MRRPVPFLTLAFALIGLAGVTISCSGSGGSSNTTRVVPTATPTAIPTPSPSPTATSMYNTLGNISCTAPNEAVPGTYVNIITNGFVTGSTYTGTGVGFSGYQMVNYTSPGPSPAPTEPPLTPATPAPSQTPGALGIIYYGEYALPAFTDTASGTPIGASDGCFQFETTQDLGGTVGEAKPAQSTPTPAPTAYGYGIGNPAFAAPYPAGNTCISEQGDNGGCAYPFNAITITNLTRTTGTGSFNFTVNGSTTTVTGTLTITGSTTYPSEPIEDGSIFRRPGAVRRR